MKTTVLTALLLAVAASPASAGEPPAANPEWAFQPLSTARPPVGHATEQVATPVDAFIVERLHAVGLELSPPADRATLIRRLSLDLLGLPPTPVEVDEFVSDRSPTARDDLVDHLLASPHFGERWGRHWLDSVGYADTVGFDVDATLIITSEGKWRYRDWVINALNADKPYDRFVTEQLAGDELVPWRTAEHYTPEIVESLVATGFLRTARDYTHEPESTIPLNYFELLHDTVEIVSSSLLGITLNCARCHDHKFDPLTQQDYYGVMACLTPAYNPTQWRVVTPYKNRDDDRTLADVSLPEKAAIDEHNAQLDKEIAAARERIASARGAGRSRLFDQRLAGVPEQIRADVRAALDTPEKSRTEVQRYLADRFKDLGKISDEEVKSTLTADEQTVVSNSEKAIAAAERQRRRYGKIQALFDVGSPPATHLLTSGDYLLPAEEVAPAILQVLSPGSHTSISVTNAPAGSSGRRLALAHRLTQPETPASALLARVYVNRIWQHLFGEGLVATSENFGAQGSTPTHPELLDWLSRRFIADGWQTKSLIRLLVTSRVYQQSSSSASRAAAVTVDPQNHLLWRMRLRRLESEIVRDSIRFASGTLSDTMGGPPVLIKAGVDGAVVVDPDKLASPDDAARRSVYLLTRRAYNESLLTVFDQPLISTTCQRRDASAVPLQSLTMLNSDLLLDQAQQFAGRVAILAGADEDARITTAYRLLLSRAPEKYINRELSWLEFNQRVLEEAQDASIPTLERLKFLAITASNLDEFFMVRVGGLQSLTKQASSKRDPADMLPEEQLQAISRRTHEITRDQYTCFLNDIEPKLREGGIVRLRSNELSPPQLQALELLFQNEIFSILTPMVVSSAADFPLLVNRTLNVCVHLRTPSDKGKEPRFALIPFGRGASRFVTLPSAGGYAYMLLEDVVAAFIERFFPGEEVVETVAFRITRNAELGLREDMAADLLAEMEEVLDAREESPCVRLEIADRVTSGLLGFLKNILNVGEADVYATPGPLDLSAFMKLTDLQGFDALRYEPWPPRPSPLVDPRASMFENISQRDILLVHPYESFEPVVRLIEEAADDPDVLAIKQTLYRTSRDSQIVAALVRAAENDKYVTAIVELKARFDEARNIEWARNLEQAGGQVIYGVKGLKTHAKVCIIVRREPGGVVRYVHFGTGNYNESTARLYSDVSYMTRDEDLGADAISFFNAVTGYSQPQRFRRIEAAPIGMREKLLEMIEVEIERKKHGQKARIIAKLNSLVDPQIIDALYAASQAGVKVQLNVRGICCLRPDVPDLSDNITVVSVVDRYLEHSRIIYFHHGGDERVFISSADWMPRNLDRRVELLVPIVDSSARDRLVAILETYFRDTVKGRRLQADGTYKPLKVKGSRHPLRSQETLYQEVCEAVRQAEQSKKTVFEPHRATGTGT